MTLPLFARRRRAWCVLGTLLLITSLAGQTPGSSTSIGYDADTKALLLARTYLEGGKNSSEAVLEALRLMGWSVRDLKGGILSAPPAGTDTGLALRDHELAELLHKPGEQPSLRLISLAQALAIPFGEVDAEELAQDLVTCIRKSAESPQPQQRFWAQFIVALGRTGPADYDLTKSAPSPVLPPDPDMVKQVAAGGIAQAMKNPLELMNLMKETPLWADDDPVLAPSPQPKRTEGAGQTTAERDQTRMDEINAEMERLSEELGSGNPDRTKVAQEKLNKLMTESAAIARRMQSAMSQQMISGLNKVNRGQSIDGPLESRFMAEWRDQPLCMLQVVLITRVLAADLRQAAAKAKATRTGALYRAPVRQAFGAIRVAQTAPGPGSSFGSQVSGALGDIWATASGGYTSLVLEHHLGENRFSEATGIANVALAWIKTILSVMRQKITIEVENSPLVRTKTRSPGEQRTARAKVEIEFPSSDALKGVRAALNVTSLDLQTPDGGPVSGAKVVWRLLEGGENTKYQAAGGGSAYNPKLACVQFAEAGSTASYVSMTNSSGEATTTLEGKPQRKQLSQTVRPYPRRGVVAVEVTLKVGNMTQDVTDAINTALGGAVSGGLSFLADMVLRTSFFFQQGQVFPVRDWKEPAWEGEFEIKVLASGTLHKKGEKGGPDTDFTWSMDRFMQGRMHTPEWEEENEQARNYAGYARHALDVSGDARGFRLMDSSSAKSQNFHNQYEAIGPFQVQPPGRNQLEKWTKAQPSGTATLTFSGGLMTLKLQPGFRALCIVGRSEQSGSRSFTKTGPEEVDLLNGLLNEFTIVQPADENAESISGSETFNQKASLPYVPDFDVKVTVKFFLHKNGPPPAAAQ